MSSKNETKSCRNCEHVEVCYLIKMLCEMLEMESAIANSPVENVSKKIIPPIMDVLGMNCRWYE
jgi:hypothetical protein